MSSPPSPGMTSIVRDDTAVWLLEQRRFRLSAGTGPMKSGTGLNVYAPLGCIWMVPTGVPLTGSFSTTGLPSAGCVFVLPSTVKPVTVVVVDGGTLALSRAFAEIGWFINVATASGASFRTAPVAAREQVNASTGYFCLLSSL